MKEHSIYFYISILNKEDQKKISKHLKKLYIKNKGPSQLFEKARDKTKEVLLTRMEDKALRIFGSSSRKSNFYNNLKLLQKEIKFFIIQQLMDDKEELAINHIINALALLKKKGSFEEYKHEVEDIESSLLKTPNISTDKYFVLHYLFKRLYYYHDNIRNRNNSLEPLIKAKTYLKKYHYIFEVSFALEARIYHKNYKSQANKQIKPNEIQTLINFGKHNDDPLIIFYSKLLDLHSNDLGLAAFQELQLLYESLAPSLLSAEQTKLGFMLLNYCTPKINNGDRNYMEIKAKLLFEWLEKRYLLEDGLISYNSFLSYISLACTLNYFEKADHFIQNYQALLIRSERNQNVIKLGRTTLAFYKKDYQFCIDQYQNTEDYPKEPINNLKARLIVLRSYFMQAITNQSDVLFQKYVKSLQSFLVYDRIHDLSSERKIMLIDTTKLYLKIINRYFFNNRKFLPSEELECFKKVVVDSNINCRTWTLDALSSINSYSYQHKS